MTLRRSPPRALLILLMVALATIGWMTSASAVVHLHEATYSWYGTGVTPMGSVIAQTIPTDLDVTKGTIAGGNIWMEVKEDVVQESETSFLYQWTVNTVALGINHPTDAIDVVPQNGTPPYEWLTSFSVPSGGAKGTVVDTGGWAFTDTGSEWHFTAPPGVGIDGGSVALIMRTNRSWTISGGGGVDYLDATGARHGLTGANWWVSHPNDTPEPGTLLLLGCGSLGLLPLLRRRRTR